MRTKKNIHTTKKYSIIPKSNNREQPLYKGTKVLSLKISPVNTQNNPTVISQLQIGLYIDLPQRLTKTNGLPRQQGTTHSQLS